MGRLLEKSEWTNQRPYFHAHDKCIEAAAEITRLRAERDALLIALHDAIRRPMGVVPASADPFYNPVFAAQAEVRRIEKDA